MADPAIDVVNLTRICEFTRALHRSHQIGGDEVIDREFNAVCRAIWGYNLDDFTDDDLSPKDHAWLDGLTQEFLPPARASTSRITCTAAA
jgi:hypothetical protein